MASTRAVTILFCDLVASTERRARLGDDAFDEFSRALFTGLRGAIAEAGGREVSSAGDGLMVAFPDSVADAVACASELHRVAALVDTHDPARLRIGISTGEVALDGDNYAGMPIVEAARLEAAAQPGQTLASAVVRSLVGTRRALRFREVGALTLKGIPEPLLTVEVVDDDDVAAVAPSAATPGSAPAPASPAVPRSRRALMTGALAVAVVGAIIAVTLVATGDDSSPDQAHGARGIPAAVGYVPHYAPTECPHDLHAKVPEATCGYLRVPEDRARPRNGRVVQLLVKQAPDRTGATTAPPTIDVCGCNDLGTSLARDRADLIQMGARGFAESTPDLTCPAMVDASKAALAAPSNDPAAIDAQTSALRTCHDGFVARKIDLNQYNFRTSALDVIDLMRALHLPRADFTASGATSAVVFSVMRQTAAAVHSITIDNPAPPGKTGLTDPIRDLSTAFQRYLAQCTRNAACANGYPDLGATYRATYAKFASQPQLVTTTDPDDATAPPIRLMLDGPRIADALSNALSDPNAYGLIPAAITNPAAQDLVATEFLRGNYFALHADAPWGALASYFCAYDQHTVDDRALAFEAQTLPEFRGANGAHWATWCGIWKVADVSNDLSDPVASPVPALLFRGDLSPIGSPTWIDEVIRGLPGGQSVGFATLGEGLISGGPPCLAQLRRDFLGHPRSKLDTQACARQSPPIEFVAPQS